ncbi:MAG: hypothetical protein PHH54_07230 [Candidatus Nanoarchaeia archaeon]|nr:hypothetical protein [Candidatus Nanoarchaeia archaeon]MDD5741748.1 hypothetical protein [Candidatus Nanoarchaeia archaeon]
MEETKYIWMDEKFEAIVAYDSFNAMFRYFPSNLKENDEHPGFIFNHRSSRFELISN